VNPREKQYSMMLDLDFCSGEVGALQDNDAVARWLDSAHERVLEAFVASLNPKFYDRLKRGE